MEHCTYLFRVSGVYQIIKFFLANVWDRGSQKTRDFLFLNINILILHYASMQSEIDGPSESDSLKQCY